MRFVRPKYPAGRLQFAPGLPRNPCGKSMRRNLRKIAWGNIEDPGDTSAVADPTVVQTLVKERVQ